MPEPFLGNLTIITVRIRIGSWNLYLQRHGHAVPENESLARNRLLYLILKVGREVWQNRIHILKVKLVLDTMNDIVPTLRQHRS
jgi:hypothetical protein